MAGDRLILRRTAEIGKKRNHWLIKEHSIFLEMFIEWETKISQAEKGKLWWIFFFLLFFWNWLSKKKGRSKRMRSFHAPIDAWNGRLSFVSTLFCFLFFQFFFNLIFGASAAKSSNFIGERATFEISIWIQWKKKRSI